MKEEIFAQRKKESLFPNLWKITKSEKPLESIVEGLSRKKSSDIIYFSAERLRWAEKVFREAERNAKGMSCEMSSNIESAVYALKDAYDLVQANEMRKDKPSNEDIVEKSKIARCYFNIISSENSTSAARSIFNEHLRGLAEVCCYAACLLEVYIL